MEEIKTIEQFNQWASKRNINLIDQLEGFKVGDIVTFKNEFGVKFHNLKILGIQSDASFYDRQIFLDTDSYWFPHKPSELTKSN